MAKEKEEIKKDPKRYNLHIPKSPFSLALAVKPQPSNADLCKKIKILLNDRLRDACAKKEFDQSAGNCVTGGGAAAPVDLLIVIDTSGSMNDEATQLSAAADAAIQSAAQSCPSDLRVQWFGIEGTWIHHDPATKFTQTYRDYLHGIGIPDTDIVGTPNDTEDGAAAVMDLSDHFDWRPSAAKAIFYLGDEALEGGDPQNVDDVTAVDSAITVASNKGVTVFTYFGTGNTDPNMLAEYTRLANGTGGQAFSAPIANIGGFQAVLEKIICASGGEACKKVEEPKIVPCLHLRWGDGPDDRLETDDTEILCITVCNPYSNVILKNFTVILVVEGQNGSTVPVLPDGTPSVQIKPDYLICFGDIPPCNPDKPDQPSCISREVVLMTRGATEGKYPLYVVYCFDACFTNVNSFAFELNLVKS